MEIRVRLSEEDERKLKSLMKYEGEKIVSVFIRQLIRKEYNNAK